MRMRGTVHEDQYTFFYLISLSSSSSEKCFRQNLNENQNTHLMFNNFFKKIVPFMRCAENMVEPDRPQMTIWCMPIACWMTEATNTHSEYITLTAFPLQQWLHEHFSMLRCTYLACLVVLEL
jgi:hypothetical protein